MPAKDGEGVGGGEGECLGCHKIPYSTKKEALTVLRRMQREVRRGPIPIRIYWCQQHKGYHTTSRPKRRNLDG
jgi:hypothetical protein